LGEPPCLFLPNRRFCENAVGIYLGDGIICVETTCAACISDGQCLNGDRCDGDEFCDGVRCSSVPPPTIDDGIDCTIDGCDTLKGVFHVPNDARCEDGNPCRENFCDPNLGCRFVSLCDDGDPCTTDICTDAGDCVHEPVICDDNDELFCNGTQVCVDGACVPGDPPCDPATQACDEARDRCAERCATDADCDDGLFCNGSEACSLFFGGCVPGIAPCRRADQICDEGCDLCVNLCAPAAATAPVGDCTFRGDTDGDGSVDLRDGRALLNFFGQGAPPGGRAEILDLNRNGRIGSEDLALFAQSMTTPR
jgi:hypothetical protein